MPSVNLTRFSLWCWSCSCRAYTEAPGDASQTSAQPAGLAEPVEPAEPAEPAQEETGRVVEEDEEDEEALAAAEAEAAAAREAERKAYWSLRNFKKTQAIHKFPEMKRILDSGSNEEKQKLLQQWIAGNRQPDCVEAKLKLQATTTAAENDVEELLTVAEMRARNISEQLDIYIIYSWTGELFFWTDRWTSSV